MSRAAGRSRGRSRRLLPLDVLVDLEVAHREPQALAILSEVGDADVAGEAQDAADPPGLVIVVDVLGRSLTADRAHASLRVDHLLNLSRSQAVPALQVVGTR